MKKIFLAVLAIAAMMVSCQKEGLVDNQKETPEVEVNEPQPVILGSNLFKAPVTKGAVNTIEDWKGDMGNDKFIYVWALNQNAAAEIDYPNPAEPAKISKVFIKNVAATLADETGTTPDTGNLGSLKLVDSDDKPFYYGTDNADIYDFYAYYLGYNPGEVDGNYFEGGTITVPDVQIKGDNDIMIASTDRVADAINNEGQMVNPNLLYSQYSARHGVTPNLVFKHQLSKFTFFVQYAGESDCDIELTGITFNKVSKSGQITLSKDNQKFVADEAQEADYINVEINEIEHLYKKVDETDDYYQNAGDIMVAPAAEYNIAIMFKQTFDGQVEPKAFDNTETLNPGKVEDINGNRLTGDDLLSFKAGKNYNVYITVYGLEEVKVDVTLTEWDEAGKIIIDRDAETDGIMKQVAASYDGDYETEDPNCTLYAEDFEQGYDIYCAFAGQKLVKAPVGTYTFTAEVGDLPSGTIITVTEEGKIGDRQ